MTVALKGSSPAALTAGILLLSRARSFGVPLQVEVVGDPSTITPVTGPAVVHSHVLASCGVGRELGQGPLVVVPGPPDVPVLMSLGEQGLGGWFSVDASGVGSHPATQAFVRLARDPRPRARSASRAMIRWLQALGAPPEPAVLDLIFLAPLPPLDRVAIGLRAGQAMTSSPPTLLTRWLVPAELPPNAPEGADGGALLELWRAGALSPWLGRLGLTARHHVESWLADLEALAVEDGGRDLALLPALMEIFAHVALLPAHGMLPPPDATADAVATGLHRVLGATGSEHDANRALTQIFRFLGGRFVDDARYPIELPEFPAPEDRPGRWRWFTRAVIDAAEHADALWRRAIDPIS